MTDYETMIKENVKMADFDSILKLNKDDAYDLAKASKNVSDDKYIIYLTWASNLGHEQAVDDLTQVYLDPKFGQNFAFTKVFYKKTAKYSFSSNYLGYMYRRGYGVSIDINKAMFYYKYAASLGNPFSYYNLGNIYENGEDLVNGENQPQGIKDLKKAFDFYNLSAKHGYSGAFAKIGCFYENGFFVDRDLVKAITFYEQALSKGYRKSLNSLFHIYVQNQMTKYVQDNKDHIFETFMKYDEENWLNKLYQIDENFPKLVSTTYFKLKSEIGALKSENERLLTHIQASPDGEIFLEAKKDWNSRLI